MMSTKFSDILTPFFPCPHLDLIYTIKFMQTLLLRLLLHDPPLMWTSFLEAPICTRGRRRRPLLFLSSSAPFSLSPLTVSLALQHLEQLLDALVPRLQGLLLRLYPRLQLLKKRKRRERDWVISRPRKSRVRVHLRRKVYL